MDDDISEAIQSFKGASKRLELIRRTPEFVAYKDFAHAPSKVVSTTNAMKNQFPDKEIIACLELHTYSSLNPKFLTEYEGALEKADRKIVYYNPEALKIKRMEPITAEDIKTSFADDEIEVVTNSDRSEEHTSELQSRGHLV